MLEQKIQDKLAEIRAAKARVEAANNERNARRKELAQILCPFKAGEMINLHPRASIHCNRALNNIEYCEYQWAIVGDIWFDNEYGYSLYVYVRSGEAGYGGTIWQGELPGHLNSHMEEFNDKTPVMDGSKIITLLAPFRVAFSEY